MCLSIKVRHPENVLSEGEHAGFQFATVHNGIGYRCGYVRVPKGHPWHGRDYDDLPANVHGGLTFAEPDVECDKPGEDDAWWIGFDCAHSGDAPDPALLTAADAFKGLNHSESVRTQEYVEAQCRRLCEQASLANQGPIVTQ